MSKNKISINIKDSVVVLHDDEVRSMVKGFDLANATPMDCYDLIKRIKELWK